MKIVILDYPRENPGEIDWSGFDKFSNVKNIHAQHKKMLQSVLVMQI